MSRKINKARFFAQSRTKSLKYMAPLAKGTVLNVIEVINGDITRVGQDDLENDQILCTNEDGALIKIPVRDFATMSLAESSKSYDSESDSNDLMLPAKITIVSSEDRKFEGKSVYPLFAYEGAQEWLDSNERDFAELVKNGPKEDNTYSPVQNYTIATEM